MLKPGKLFRKRRDILDGLTRVATREGADLDRVTDDLRVLFDAERATIHRPVPSAVGYHLDFQYTSGFTVGQRVAHVNWLASAERFMAYSPERPERDQRNVVVSIGASDYTKLATVERSRQLFEHVGMNALGQHRVVVCDGSVLLAWVGAMREAPLSDAESRVFRSLIGPLQQALRLTQVFREADIAAAGIAVLLERIEAPAFILSPRGPVKYANEVGKRLLDSDLASTQQQLLAALHEGAPSDDASNVDVSELALAAMPRYKLVILRRTTAIAEKLELARRLWELSPRQVEVLALLVRGEANKLIAHRLSCAERTVEAHVTAMLRASRTQSRVELVSRVLTLR